MPWRRARRTSEALTEAWAEASERLGGLHRGLGGGLGGLDGGLGGLDGRLDGSLARGGGQEQMRERGGHSLILLPETRRFRVL